MIGNQRAAETVRAFARDAGALLLAVAVLASLALGLAAGAFYVAGRALRASRPS